MNYLFKKIYMPLDKSWIIRMGILDLMNGYDSTVRFLEQNLSDVGGDLKALHKASINWHSHKTIYVGESATLYRFLKFASWKKGLNKDFILEGTLIGREICNDSEIANYSLEKLLQLDNKTSQWASASALLGNNEKIENPPYKLKVTYEAVLHWKERRSKGKCWEPRYDETILKQATAFLKLLRNGKADFVAEQAEDYCFARTFGFIEKEEGARQWPSLFTHESNRIEMMENVLKNSELGEKVNSKDHRVVQAYAMLQKLNGREIRIAHKECVGKSWTQFWKFLEDADKLKCQKFSTSF
ncbi:hypothetical protein HYU07_04465 [Candidatus Woesearchaeota archaeon]|nr:hypothetical protein [Candidatus Woesearchaeota archaeon]